MLIFFSGLVLARYRPAKVCLYYIIVVAGFSQKYCRNEILHECGTDAFCVFFFFFGALND